MIPSWSAVWLEFLAGRRSRGDILSCGANNQPLLHAWRVSMAMLAIIFIKRLIDVLSRIRMVSLRNL